MNIDKQMHSERISGKISMVLVFIFGIIGVFSPFGSIFVATYNRVTEFTVFTSTMLLLLAMLVIIFLVIFSFSSFINNQKGTFILTIIILLLCIISFLLNLAIFVTI